MSLQFSNDCLSSKCTLWCFMGLNIFCREQVLSVLSEWSWLNLVATVLNTSCFPFLLNRAFSTRTPTAILKSSTAMVTNPRTCKLSSHDIRGQWMSSHLCTGHCCSQESWIFCGKRGYFLLSFPFFFGKRQWLPKDCWALQGECVHWKQTLCCISTSAAFGLMAQMVTSDWNDSRGIK